MSDIIQRIRNTLQSNSDAKTLAGSKKFFKEEVRHYGVKTAVVGKIGREYFNEVKDLQKNELFKLCEELWQSGILEETFIACDWCYRFRKVFVEKDIDVFEMWINRYVTNWASCDTFCNHTVGTFIEMYPQYLQKLKEWARSENRWMRRASAVSLIVPAKKGLFLNDVFGISDILLLDKDDLVQKGYGWMLKVASHIHQKEVFDYIMAHKHNMPRTSLRYAIEKMPKELKTKAMEVDREYL